MWGARAETVPQVLWRPHQQSLELVCGLASGLQRRLASRSQEPNHLYLAVAALRLSDRLTGQHRPGCCLRVDGVGFAVAPEVAPLWSLDLHHRDSCSLQVAGKSGPVAAGPLYTGASHRAKAFRPTQESLTNAGVSHSLSLCSVPLAHPGACPTGPEPPPRAQVEVSVHAQDHSVHAGGAFRIAEGSLHVCCSFQGAVIVFAQRSRSGQYCEGSGPWQALIRSRSGRGRLRSGAPNNDRRVTRKALLSRRIDGSGQSRTPPATTYSVFTAE